VADVKVSKESSQQGRSGQLQRRGETFPSPFSLSPRDFFAMSPFQMMRRFTEDLDRMFTGHEFTGGALWSPPVEVRQQGNNMVVTAELPGLNKEDIHVEVTDEGLAISGERKREHEEQREGYYRSERSYGQFYRLIPLPENANTEQIKANFNNGVLEVSVAVPQAEQKRREVPIEAQTTRTSGGGAGA
jgi:HSP20 family protein